MWWQKLETLQQLGGKNHKSYKQLNVVARNNQLGKNKLLH
jgi:hypothetical protein